MRFPLSFLFSKDKRLNSFSLPSLGRLFGPLIIVMVFVWTLSTLPAPFLKDVDQNWTQDSRWSLTRAEQRDMVVFLYLLAVCLWLQSKMCFAFVAAAVHS